MIEYRNCKKSEDLFRPGVPLCEARWFLLIAYSSRGLVGQTTRYKPRATVWMTSFYVLRIANLTEPSCRMCVIAEFVVGVVLVIYRMLTTVQAPILPPVPASSWPPDGDSVRKPTFHSTSTIHAMPSRLTESDLAAQVLWNYLRTGAPIQKVVINTQLWIFWVFFTRRIESLGYNLGYIWDELRWVLGPSLKVSWLSHNPHLAKKWSVVFLFHCWTNDSCTSFYHWCTHFSFVLREMSYLFWVTLMSELLSMQRSCGLMVGPNTSCTQQEIRMASPLMK